jgi:hypothetical protein
MFSFGSQYDFLNLGFKKLVALSGMLKAYPEVYLAHIKVLELTNRYR